MSTPFEQYRNMVGLWTCSYNPIFLTSLDGFIFTANPAAEKVFEFPVNELINRQISELFDGSVRISDLAPSGGIRTIDMHCKAKSGRTLPARLSILNYPQAGRSQTFTIIIVRRKLPRPETDQHLDHRLKFEHLVSLLSTKFINLPYDQIDQEIDYALQKMRDYLGKGRISLSELSDDGRIVKLTHSVSPNGPSPYFAYDLSKRFPVLGMHIRTGELTLLSNLPDDFPPDASAERKAIFAEKINSMLIVPLIVGESLLGALSCLTFSGEPTWTDDQIGKFQVTSNIFANALMRKQSEGLLQQAFVEIEQLKRKIEQERNYLREEIRLEHNHKDIIGSSQAIKKVLKKVEQVAQTDTAVMILGETGTGKELIARAIHSTSGRSAMPLVKVNCAALPTNLIESELFGHEKGAFTSAETARSGRFEIANGGTLFLDEIGELPIEIQSKLLRVLQEGEFERLGSSKTIKVDIRIIAASNRNIEEEIKSGRFRQDLWYRLNVFPITVPPLRQHKEDIPQLVSWFVKKFSKKLGKQIDIVPEETIRNLQQYSWPGNIRELENFIQRAMIKARGSTLLVSKQSIPASIVFNSEKASSFKTFLEMEREYILEVLNAAGGRVSGPLGAALILGMNPETLRSRMKKLKIRNRGFQ